MILVRVGRHSFAAYLIACLQAGNAVQMKPGTFRTNRRAGGLRICLLNDQTAHPDGQSALNSATARVCHVGCNAVSTKAIR